MAKQLTTAGSSKAVTHGPRPYSADWDSVEKLIGHETNDSLRIDLRMPRSLLYAVASAYLDGVQTGEPPTAVSILAGPFGKRVVEAFENCCDEALARKTQRILLPLPNVVKNPLRMIVVELFKAPGKISQKFAALKAPFELEFVGKDRSKVASDPQAAIAGKTA